MTGRLALAAYLHLRGLAQTASQVSGSDGAGSATAASATAGSDTAGSGTAGSAIANSDGAARAPAVAAAHRGGVVGNRPAGPVVWLHAETADDFAALSEPADRLMQTGKLGGVILTGQTDAETDLAPGVMAVPGPADTPTSADRFLDLWRPDLAVLTGSPMLPAIVQAVGRRKLPLLLVAGRMTPQSYRRWRWLKPVARGMLGRFGLLMAEDWRSARYMRRLGAADGAVELSGGLERALIPLGCAEAEREVLGAQLRTRPVWLAAGVPLSEAADLIAAQGRASRTAHRLLLVIVPEGSTEPGPGLGTGTDAARASRLAQQVTAIATLCTQAGLEFGVRSRDDEPEDEMQVYVADLDGELGLWYRLAPVTFIGGSLSGGGSTRDPFEAAALGSAILHGPQAGGWAHRFARLGEGRAARTVASAAELGETVADLIAPDRAALLAHNAWQVVSSGADLADRLVGLMIAQLEAGLPDVSALPAPSPDPPDTLPPAATAAPGTGPAATPPERAA